MTKYENFTLNGWQKRGLWIGSHCTLNRAKLQPELNRALCSWRAIWVAESTREETFKRGHASLPFALTTKKVFENLRYSTVAVELWRWCLPSGRNFGKITFVWIHRALENYLASFFMKLSWLKLFHQLIR